MRYQFGIRPNKSQQSKSVTEIKADGGETVKRVHVCHQMMEHE